MNGAASIVPRRCTGRMRCGAWRAYDNKTWLLKPLNQSLTIMQPIAPGCIVHCDRKRLRPHTHMLLTTTPRPRVITRSWAPIQPPPPSLYLHLFVYLPFHRVSWFSASFIFRRSALLFHLCHVFSAIVLSIFAARPGERRGARERQRRRRLFTVARRRASRSSSAARVTLVMPPRARGARLSQPCSARILRGPCASGEPPL